MKPESPTDHQEQPSKRSDPDYQPPLRSLAVNRTFFLALLFSGNRIHLTLFVATVVSTMMAGAFWHGFNPFASVGNILHGWQFSAVLLSILLAHEMGHYLTSRYHNVPASLPYFIPVPPVFIPTPTGPAIIPTFGTLGAIIRMRAPVQDRRILFDIGISGPLAGICVAIPATILGLTYSTLVEIPASAEWIEFGDSLLFLALCKLVLGPVSETQTVLLHPIAFAGWLGFFITSLNLLSVGQLDGGHVTYGIFGRRHGVISRCVFLCLILWGVHGALIIVKPITWLWGLGLIWALALIWIGKNIAFSTLPVRKLRFVMLALFFAGIAGNFSPNTMVWLFWAILMSFMGLDHPPTRDIFIPLNRKRKLLGWSGLIIFLLTFVPMPFITNFSP